jgi:hypothetical protein
MSTAESFQRFNRSCEDKKVLSFLVTKRKCQIDYLFAFGHAKAFVVLFLSLNVGSALDDATISSQL